MDDKTLQTTVVELLGNISILSPAAQANLNKLSEDERKRNEKLRQSLVSLQESLDTLSLQVKYMVFDLDVTREENQELVNRCNQLYQDNVALREALGCDDKED